MYSPFVRSLFVVSSLGLSGFFFFVGNTTSGYLFLACAGLFSWTLYRHGSVLRAFRLYRDGEMQRARHSLRLADASKWDDANKSYRALLEGVFKMEEGHLVQAKTHFDEVDPTLLRSDDHRGLLKVHLAELAFRKGETEAARILLDDATELARDDRTRHRIDTLLPKLKS